ncbi:MAG: ABC transporter substrate-binding protein [Betaproteobacteria bacterium]|nr:ABC transporter substrate-binding protein [Betaproteobacteria bacterium]
MVARRLAAAIVALLCAIAPARAQDAAWADVLAKARGQTVHWNAWAGDEKTNAFIAWVGDEVAKRHGVKVVHVKLKDTAEAVTRVVAEKAAGRDSGGSVDLVWINGANFLALRQQKLLYGPYAERLPNWRYVDTAAKRSNLVDFTIPHEGYESPWRMAQLVFVYDSRRVGTPPSSVAALLAWAKAHPGRFTHPNVRNFLGSTFLKQALYELAPDPSVLQRPATDANFASTTAPMWAWYDALKPTLWRGGAQFPENGPAQRQLMNDGEIDMMVSFNPSEAAVSASAGLLPESVRTFTFAKGTIGNTSFVAIPYNATAKEGAMVVADFLLAPATQARAQDIRQMGNFTVLDLAKLAPEDRRRFDELPRHPALPTNAELGTTLLEPHPSWMTRIATEWERRYTK